MESQFDKHKSLEKLAVTLPEFVAGGLVLVWSAAPGSEILMCLIDPLHGI